MRFLLLLVACAPSPQDINAGERNDLGDLTDHNFVPDGGTADGSAANGDGGGGLPAGPFSVTGGLFGGTIEAVAVAPGAVYVGTGGAGVFKSTDNGNHFVAASVGLGPSTIWHIVVDPTQPASLWAVSNKGARNGIFNYGDHVYHSSDGAASWTELTPSPLPMPENFHQIAVAGNDVYMAGSPALYHSSDGGQTWASSSTALAGDGPVDLALDPTNPKTA